MAIANLAVSFSANTVAVVQTVGTAAGSTATVIAANVNRAGWGIQNQGTSPLYVALGAGCTNLAFHVVLKCSSALSDGSGATFAQMAGSVYQGIVTASGSGATYTVWEY